MEICAINDEELQLPTAFIENVRLSVLMQRTFDRFDLNIDDFDVICTSRRPSNHRLM